MKQHRVHILAAGFALAAFSSGIPAQHHDTHGSSAHGHDAKSHTGDGHKAHVIHAVKAHDPHGQHGQHTQHGHGMVANLAHTRAHVGEYLRKNGADAEQVAKFEALILEHHSGVVDLHAAETKAHMRLAWKMQEKGASLEASKGLVDDYHLAKAAMHKHMIESTFKAKRILGAEVWKKVGSHLKQHMHHAVVGGGHSAQHGGTSVGKKDLHKMHDKLIHHVHELLKKHGTKLHETATHGADKHREHSVQGHGSGHSHTQGHGKIR